MLKAFFKKNTPRLYVSLRRCKGYLHERAIAFHVFLLKLFRRDCDVMVVIGMRRTGNHAVINWIKHQCDGSFLFFNNITPECSPFSALMKEQKIGFSGKPLLVFSYEDKTFDAINSAPLNNVIKQFCRSPDKNVKTVLILRDPYNLFASRLKKWPEVMRNADSRDQLVELWKSYASEFGADRIPGEQRALVSVNYNEFVQNPGYRQQLSQQLGLRYTDKGLEKVAFYGHGSSFDIGNIDKAALELDVLKRWTVFQDDEDFWRLFEDAKLQRLSQEIFRPAELPLVPSFDRCASP